MLNKLLNLWRWVMIDVAMWWNDNGGSTFRETVTNAFPSPGQMTKSSSASQHHYHHQSMQPGSAMLHYNGSMSVDDSFDFRWGFLLAPSFSVLVTVRRRLVVHERHCRGKVVCCRARCFAIESIRLNRKMEFERITAGELLARLLIIVRPPHDDRDHN